MIDEHRAQAYIKKFALMKGYPRASELRFEAKIELLVEHFRKAASDELHGDRIIEWVQQNKRFCPETADLWEAARATTGGTGEGEARKFRECSRCCEGWESVLIHARWSQDKKPRAGFIEEIIADIAPSVGDYALLSDPMRYLTDQQFARLEHLRNAFPAGYHSRFTTATRRCARCWGGRTV